MKLPQRKKTPASDDKASYTNPKPESAPSDHDRRVQGEKAGVQNPMRADAKEITGAENEPAEKKSMAGSGEKSIDDLLKELADTLKAPSDKSKENAREDYGKKLEEILSMLKEEDGEKRGER